MSLFKKNDTEKQDMNQNFDAWDEQVRLARNPSSLTPEELLGFKPSTDNKKETFTGTTAKSLYTKMLERRQEEIEAGSNSEDSLFETSAVETAPQEDNEEIQDETPFKDAQAILAQTFSVEENEPEQITFEFVETEEENDPEEAEIEDYQETEEEVVIDQVSVEEPIVSTKTESTSSDDDFEDFFRRLDKEIAYNKPPVPTNDSLYITEVDKSYNKTTEPEQTFEADKEILQEQSISDSDKAKIEELLSIVYGKAHSEPTIDIVPSESEKSEEPLTKEPQNEVVLFENETENQDEDLEKTQMIELPEQVERHTPKHSLYSGSSEYHINKQAIDDFFGSDAQDETKLDIKIPAASKQVKTPEPIIIEEPEEESAFDVFSDDIEDYKDLNNAAEIKSQLITRKHRITVRSALTAVLTLLMLFINGGFLESRGYELGIIPNAINLVLLLITVAINYPSFIGMFTGDRDTDVCCSAVSIITVIQSVAALIFFGGSGAGLGALAGFSILISLIGKYLVCSTTIKGLCVIATNEKKHAITMVEDKTVSSEIASGATEGEACVAFGKETVNLQGYLKNWYRTTPADKSSVKYTVISLVVAILAFIASVFMFDIWQALSIAVIAFSLCCAPSVFLLYSLSSKVMSDSLRYYDAAIGGFNAANALGECNAVAMSADDLFPQGSVVLHNMMPLSANSVDKSLQKAAALAKATRSPLISIFEDILKDSREPLPEIEDVKYENKLGVSGWIKDECILIGNRTLMENHNVKTPSSDFDRKILSAGYKPVYIACNGKPCLLLVVQYSADENVKYELNRLCNTGAVAVVCSSDPNVTKQLVCEQFDLMDEDVYLMSQSGASKLRAEAKFNESVNGFAVYKKNIGGLLYAISASIRLGSVNALMKAFHIIGIIASLAAVGWLVFSSGFVPSLYLIALAIQLFFVCVTFVVPYIKRP